MPEVSGAGGRISAMRPTITTMLSYNNCDLPTKAVGARRAGLAKQLLKLIWSLLDEPNNYGRFEDGDEHEEFCDQSRETQGQRSASAIVHRRGFVWGEKPQE